MSLCSSHGWWLDGLTDWMAGGCGVRSAAFRNVPFQAAKRHVSHVNTCRFGVPNGRYAASALGWRLVVVSFFCGRNGASLPLASVAPCLFHMASALP